MPSDLAIPASDSVTEADPEQRETALDTALWCAGQGWPVHPLAPGRKTPAANCPRCQGGSHSAQDCPCIPAGLWCHGFHAATTDRSRITGWWGRRPDLGVGVACGPAGLVVIDVDTHETPLPGPGRLLPGITTPAPVSLRGLRDGFHSLALLAALRDAADPAKDTATLRVRTPSGGLHIWYAAGAGEGWRCSAGSGAGRALAWQVDVRAHGGCIVAPGTVTAAGRYTVEGPARRPAPLPGWLAAELDRTGHRNAPSAPAPSVPARGRYAVLAATGARGWAHYALDAVLAPVTTCAEVTTGAAFTDKLNRAAYTAGGLVAAGWMGAADAESALFTVAGHARPGQERRIAQIIRSGMASGSRRPLNPGERS
ncbi:bifunctional DNA primase/polymerase [Streptomyces sp. NBC_00388]|uniref:bifunctional DNA primase/polymerase n=1 Tax=Streptomyces sp. NBC_00388 TaxID=2975735 RepID=UPI002E1FE73C